jgi:hypothetical protein
MLACIQGQATMTNSATDSNSYEVGYKKPPRHTRFQLGNRANPNGRPKHDSSLMASYEKLLEEHVVTRNGRAMTNREAMLRVMINDAMHGNQKAFARFLKLARRAGLLSVSKKENSGNSMIRELTEKEKQDYRLKYGIKEEE